MRQGGPTRLRDAGCWIDKKGIPYLIKYSETRIQYPETSIWLSLAPECVTKTLAQTWITGYVTYNNPKRQGGLRPHDLRRHAATHASRSGTPIEIVSKVILRHANLSTTQRYLGKVSDVEALRWIENVYA